MQKVIQNELQREASKYDNKGINMRGFLTQLIEQRMFSKDRLPISTKSRIAPVSDLS